MLTRCICKHRPVSKPHLKTSLGWSNYDSLSAHGRVVQSVIGSRERSTAENGVPYHISHHWSGDMVRGILWAGGDPGRIGCLECPLTRLVLERSESQTVLTERDYSIMELQSGRDRPLSLCVLRWRDSEPKTRWIGEWRPPSPASASS